jgi:hypothetical protein
MRHLLAAFVLGFLVSASLDPGPAQAQTIAKITPEQFTTALKRAGYPGEVKKGQDNDKFVLTKMQNYNVVVFFFNCDNAGCPAIEFFVKFTKDDALNVDYANSWNKQYRFAKASIADDGGLVFVYDVAFTGGVTQQHVQEMCKLYDLLLETLNGFNPG